MSVDFEGQAEVWREGIRRARKAHHCSACDGGIRRGELYSYTFTVYDGDTDTVRRCAACELIYRHLVLAFVTPAEAQSLLSVVVPVKRLPRDHAAFFVRKEGTPVA
jgi:hypothetical protein